MSQRLIGNGFKVVLMAGAVSFYANGRVRGGSIDFNHDIRPILSNNCFMCHGPDSHQRKAKLRLDSDEDAHAQHEHGVPFVRGDLEKSEVLKRIVAADQDDLMPPVKSGKKLSPHQIDLLRQWVKEGAKYEKHWAFIPPKRAALPEVKDAAWCRNGIDRFILARLEAEGLKPSPEADKVTLCRRLYLDLLGLPPTIKEVDAFVADNSPDAYEKLVDRLLANPHYGERMALDWLDASRFADTHGYHIDAGRDQTRWRDWVINAFNKNEPFDQFTVEQLAGDLLPNATDDQKVATGFVRNNMINFEGGAIPEEYLTAYIMDRVNTTSMVWLGLTLNCCTCHDHKFDPFTQKDYYRMYAFFNAVPENGLDGRTGNAGPLITTPTKEQREKLASIDASIAKLKEELAEPNEQYDKEQVAWEKSAGAEKHAAWTNLEPSHMKSAGGATMTLAEDKSVLVTGNNPPNDTYTLTAKAGLGDITAIRLEALPDDKLRAHGPGRSENGNAVLSEVRVTASTGADGKSQRKIKLSRASADFSQETFPVAGVIEEGKHPGWALFPEVGKPHRAILQLAEPLHHATDVTLTITLAFKSQFSQHQLGHFRLAVTDASSPDELDAMPEGVRKTLNVASESRSEVQKSELREYFRRNICVASRGNADEIASLTKEKQQIEKSEPTTMVMQDMAKPRETHVLVRGQYDKFGDVVTADVPQSLGLLPADVPHNRLGLARWIVAPKQPLTSRVIVNRYWQSLFGTGIVKTVEDFGSQGEEPTHPELLDWLAVQFMDPQGEGSAKPWDVKAMLKLIVTSSTYRQSSVATQDIIARDPENRLLSHMSRFRLPAEFIRDEALAISGLMNDEIGGKSVSPYQPPGLWEELMKRSDGANWTAQVYVQDHGKDLYRRSMYTFWKRTSPPPSLSTFDAAGARNLHGASRETNTPLQALVLMNDPTYVEASRKLAERMMNEAGGDESAKITFAFRLATSRTPTQAEIDVLRHIYDRQLAVYQKDVEGAKKLLSVGESSRDEKLDVPQLAAWTAVGSVIINLDETITKG